MRWEQARSMEKKIGRKRNRAGEEKEGRRKLRENGRGKGLGEGREEREMKKEQAIRMGERVKLERRDKRIRREGNGKRRESKGREEREKRGWEKGESDTLSTLQTRPIRLDTLLINRYNEPIYFINMKWHVGISQRPHMSLVMRKPTFWFLTWSYTNQTVQPQKMARGLKFRI